MDRYGTLRGMPNGLLEVIAVDAEDARRAVSAGADRLELVSSMYLAGLCPSPETVEAVLETVDVPVRVMLRLSEGFGAGGPAGVERLIEAAERLRAAGAREFVLGWLDERGGADMDAITRVLPALGGHAWTFHKAVDDAGVDREALFRQIRGLPGLDTVLSSGGPVPAGQGADVLAAEAAREAGLGATGLKLLVGGGLRLEDVAGLRARGLTDFHVGSAVRVGGSWEHPVDPGIVEHWRAAVEG
jgi:copper homeostasis protein